MSVAHSTVMLQASVAQSDLRAAACAVTGVVSFYGYWFSHKRA